MTGQDGEKAKCPTCGSIRLECRSEEAGIKRCHNCNGWLRFNGRPLLEGASLPTRDAQ